VLADALEAALPPCEDRDQKARPFAGSGADALRTSIAKACAAAAIPLWSPHDLRHRRISLLHLRGVPWARIGEFVGQRSLSVTADIYSHVLSDETELDYAALLACAGVPSIPTSAPLSRRAGPDQTSGPTPKTHLSPVPPLQSPSVPGAPLGRP
jgi:hypothetical protein